MGGTNLVNLPNVKNICDKICKAERIFKFNDNIFAKLGFRIEICKKREIRVQGLEFQNWGLGFKNPKLGFRV